MDPETTPVQPAEGQGQGTSQPDAGNGLYPDLSAVPESIRAQVEPLLREWEGNVTRKFQEAAEYRKQWEPLQDMGLQEIDPDELRELLAFREVASDPDAFQSWYQSIGEQMGLGPEPEGDPGQGEDFKSIIEEALNSRLGPIEQAYQSQQEAAVLAQAESMIASELDSLQEEHGEFDRDVVCQLALAYEGQEAVRKGFADYQRLVGNVEKGVFSKKLDAPDPAESGGKPVSQAGPPKTFAEATAAARAMVQHSMST